jgi:acyl-CoA thioester hydrolase
MSCKPQATHRRRIEWVDTDASGIYHNTAVVRLAEAAEAELMRQRGLDDYFPEAPRVHYEVDFESPLRFGQDATATVVLERLGSRSMGFRFEVWKEADVHGPRVRAAHGSYVTVHVRQDGSGDGRGHSEPWPEAWVRALTTTVG